MANKNAVKEPLFHITKRENVSKKKAIGVRAIASGAVLVLAILLSLIFVKKGPIFLVVEIFNGTFGNSLNLWRLVYETAILLLIALAVVPAFKMKFWNIGADGQTLISAITCYGVFFYLRNSLPGVLVTIIALIASILVGIVWTIIPSIFKAKWNTNETLFTLMMNYVATQLAKYFIYIWSRGNTRVPYISQDILPQFGSEYLLSVLIIALVTILVYVYLKHTKHGFELSLVGESQNTAKYIGLNVKKVIIRTMILSGAICGLSGFILVSISKSVTSTTVAGMGFTAIIVAWLAKFNPLYMILSAFVVQFLQLGLGNFINEAGVGSVDFAQIIIGLVYLFIIGCEFFIRYKVVIRRRKRRVEDA